MTKKLLVIGWDAATANDISNLDLQCHGSLEHGGELLPEPYWQQREVDSGTAWTTLTTGLSMWDHRVGMLSGLIENDRLFQAFSSVDRFIPQSVLGKPLRIWLRSKFLGEQPTNHDIPYKRLWHYIPNSLSFAVPLTYPPKATSGVTVSGFPSPSVEVYPSSHKKGVRRRYSGEPHKFDDGDLRPEYVDELFRMHENARDTILWLDTQEDFEFYFIVFTFLDRLYHVSADDSKDIDRGYRLLDETTQTLINEIDPDDTLILSDHGMRYDPRGKWSHVHDETEGIWASTYNFCLETHLDVTPAVLDYYDYSMADPEYEEERFVTNKDEVTDRLQDLGYV